MIKNIQNVRFTREHVNSIIYYLTQGETFSMPKSSYYHFIKRYNEEQFSVNKHGKLFYQDREVIPLEKVNAKLDQLYNDSNYFHASVSGFYNRIITEFVGISRSTIEEFLKNKRPAQLFHKTVSREVMPIISHFPRSMFNIDFIDLKSSAHANLGYRYLLNIVDHFSKFAWTFPLKSRDSFLATDVMKDLFEEHTPRVLHADNEFRNTELQTLADDHGIKLVFSEPYRPWANGSVERFNQTQKKMIKEIQEQYLDKTFLDILGMIMRNYNNTHHSAHGKTPYQVYFGSSQVVNEADRKMQKYRLKKYLESILMQKKFR